MPASRECGKPSCNGLRFQAAAMHCARPCSSLELRALSGCCCCTHPFRGSELPITQAELRDRSVDGLANFHPSKLPRKAAVSRNDYDEARELDREIELHYPKRFFARFVTRGSFDVTREESEYCRRDCCRRSIVSRGRRIFPSSIRGLAEIGAWRCDDQCQRAGGTH